jgi:TRAP-type C4-dicarboxylate transport system permease small subunit
VRTLYDRSLAALQFIAAVLLALMLLLVLAGVLYRYVFDDSLSWYDEFAGYLLVWLTMVGSVVGLAKGKHIGFETLVETFPPRVRRGVALLGVLCIVAFSLVMLVSGGQLVREMEGETAISLPWVKMAWIYSIMPISGALMLVVCAVQFRGILRPSPAGGPGDPGRPMDEGQ